VAFRFKKLGWFRSSGTRGATAKHTLPSCVRLLGLNGFYAYGMTGEHAGVTWDVGTRWVLDYQGVPGSHELVGPNHVLGCGPMLVTDLLRRGVGPTTISRTEHDCQAWGGGDGWKGANRSGDRTKKSEGATTTVPFILPYLRLSSRNAPLGNDLPLHSPARPTPGGRTKFHATWPGEYDCIRPSVIDGRTFFRLER